MLQHKLLAKGICMNKEPKQYVQVYLQKESLYTLHFAWPMIYIFNWRQ